MANTSSLFLGLSKIYQRNEMIFCEHFIYTTAQTEVKTGYQVIAKSKGISADILSELQDYLFPIGINPSKFSESRSLLILKRGKIAYSKIKNIGIGYDGRDNTLYNHTIIANLDDFKKNKFDSKIFDDYYIEEPFRKNRELIPFYIPIRETTVYAVPHDVKTEVIKEILVNIFRFQKIAILYNKTHLIQDVLSIVPPSLRLVSFSTLVVQPDIQSKYRIIQISKQSKSLLPPEFTIVDVQSGVHSTSNKKDMLDENIDFLVNIITSKLNLMPKIYDEFESIPDKDFVNKINLITNYEQLKLSIEKNERKKFAYDTLQTILQSNPDTGLMYLKKIENEIDTKSIQDCYAKLKIKKIVTSSSLSVDLKNIEKLLDEIKFEGTYAHLALLNELVDFKKTEFLKKGANLLVDTSNSYSWYKDEIFRIFVEHRSLRKCIFEIFNENYELSEFRKNNLYESIIDTSKKYGTNLIPDLLKHIPFDILSREGSQKFKRIIKSVLSELIFQDINAHIIFNIIRNSRSIIKDHLEKLENKKNSSINVNMFDVVVVLKESLRCIGEKNNDPEFVSEIVREEKILQKIHDELKQSSKNYSHFSFSKM